MSDAIPVLMDRYPGIRAFNPGEAKLFFGRRQETEDLLSLVKTRSLTVLFAKSGIGKSSLINAGLIPKLREHGFFPIVVRFQSTELSPLDIMGKTLDAFIDKEMLARHLPPGGEAELWHKIKASKFGENGDQVPLFLLDQFEELFGHAPEKRAEFTRQLADLVENRLPEAAQEALQSIPRSERTPEVLEWHTPAGVKFLFAIRSDLLHYLNEMTTAIPAVLTTGNRFELRPLNRLNAREAIVEPARLDGSFSSPVFTYEEATLDDILTNLSSQKGDEIESFQLQILCGEIEKKVVAKGAAGVVVTPDYLGGAEGIKAILNNYYENSIGRLGDDSSKTLARHLIEDQLIADRKRIGAAVETVTLPKELVEKLLASRIIRVSNTHLGDVFEISHDTLVDPIVKSRDARREREAAERAAVEKAEQEKIFAEQQARLEQERSLRESAEKAKYEAEEAKNLAFSEKIKAEKAARRAYMFSLSSLVLLFSSLVFGWYNIKQEKDSYLKQADSLQKQKQFREAADVYNRLLDKRILDFTGYDRDSVSRTAVRMLHLDSIKQVVTAGDSLYFVGSYRLALANYRDAEAKKYPDNLGDRIQRTEQVLGLAFEIFNRKAETYFSLWLADRADAMAAGQACFYVKKALDLRPDDRELQQKSEALKCE